MRIPSKIFIQGGIGEALNKRVTINDEKTLTELSTEAVTRKVKNLRPNSAFNVF